jgi:fermentation-respiration switch protein FrsA (DUF1100 family)
VPLRVQALAAGLFGLVLVATSGFLWVAHTLAAAQLAGAAAALVAALWGVGRLLEGRQPQPDQAEAVEAGEAPTSVGRAIR